MHEKGVWMENSEKEKIQRVHYIMCFITSITHSGIINVVDILYHDCTQRTTFPAHHMQIL